MNRRYSLLTLVLAAVGVCGAQIMQPVKVVKPMTYTQLTCPKGYQLWAREQYYFKVIPGTAMGQVLYKWKTWDGLGALFDGDNATPTCYVNGIDPNVSKAKESR